jgi:hypothetical protein
VVIDPTPGTQREFLAALPAADFYVDHDVALDALRHRSRFNVIDIATAWKLDLILRKERPFSHAEFARRQPAELLGAHVFVATAEDTIIANLEWAVMADSERQFRDVAGILAVRGESIDRAYIERWITALDLTQVWRRVASKER